MICYASKVKLFRLLLLTVVRGGVSFACALMEDGAGLRMVHGLLREGLLIQPAPWGVFAKQQPLYLYFESYGLRKNNGGQTQYSVEVVLVEAQKEKGLAKLIRRAFGRKQGEGVSARYDGGGDRTDEGQYLLLDVSQESAGTYVLAVRVTDQVTGKEVQAQRRVILE